MDEALSHEHHKNDQQAPALAHALLGRLADQIRAEATLLPPFLPLPILKIHLLLPDRLAVVTPTRRQPLRPLTVTRSNLHTRGRGTRSIAQGIQGGQAGARLRHGGAG